MKNINYKVVLIFFVVLVSVLYLNISTNTKNDTTKVMLAIEKYETSEFLSVPAVYILKNDNELNVDRFANLKNKLEKTVKKFSSSEDGSLAFKYNNLLALYLQVAPKISKNEILEYANALVKLDSQNSYAHYILASLYVEFNDLEKAKMHFDSANSLEVYKSYYKERRKEVVNYMVDKLHFNASDNIVEVLSYIELFRINALLRTYENFKKANMFTKTDDLISFCKKNLEDNCTHVEVAMLYTRFSNIMKSEEFSFYEKYKEKLGKPEVAEKFSDDFFKNSLEFGDFRAWVIELQLTNGFKGVY